MDIEITRKIIDDNRELLSLPQTLAEVLRVVRDDNSTASDVGNVILKDPALTARILSVVNSAFYGLNRRIGSVPQAVMTLGMRQVSALALSCSVYSLTERLKGQIDLNRFWRHSLEVAIASRMIAEATKRMLPEEAFVAGLLHDIGILILEKSFPEKYARVWRAYQKGRHLAELEDEAWGTSHPRVGQFLLEQWNLPPGISFGVGYHHQEFMPDSTNEDMTPAQIVALANSLSQLSIAADVSPRDAYTADNLDIMRRNLGVTQESLTEIAKRLLPETVDEARFLEIDIGSPEEIVLEANRVLFEQYLTVENLLRENRQMQQQIAQDQVKRAALSALKTVNQTFNSYITNASSTMLSRVRLLEQGLKSGEINDISGQLIVSLEVIANGISTIKVAMEELVNLTSSEAMVCDDNAVNDSNRKIKQQLSRLGETASVA